MEHPELVYLQMIKFSGSQEETLGKSQKNIKAVLQNWAASIDINFSFHKTKSMLITRETSIIALTLTLGGRKIDLKLISTKFLGCIINWNPHIDYIKATCSRRLKGMKSLTMTT